jgi:hypothetical protein
LAAAVGINNHAGNYGSPQRKNGKICNLDHFGDSSHFANPCKIFQLHLAQFSRLTKAVKPFAGSNLKDLDEKPFFKDAARYLQVVF